MGRSPCCDEAGVKKGPWTTEEDEKLVEYIQKHGHGSWRLLPMKAGLNRCGKSCRLRWTNYLRPDIKRGKFDDHEEQLIIHLHSILGNKWSSIATQLPGRTDNEIKNYWNTHLKKKLMRMGIDPITHRRRPDLELIASLPNHLGSTNSSNLASSWDQALQLQTDVAQFARMQILQVLLQVLTSPSSSFCSILGSPFASPPNFPASANLIQLECPARVSPPLSSATSAFGILPTDNNHRVRKESIEAMENFSRVLSSGDSRNGEADNCSTPPLVSSSPEHASANASFADNCLSSMNPSDAWDAMHLVDEDGTDLCWKDILECGF
ncbi:hypothetical protein HPP92_014857 [Vanilla planifolia]|uniref:Uncharacterized protein n=1 Tax=Vanilla planifolia TaxID=51239 RepID=A0A835QGS8_VANPL|nr:hypothetical protein HPP92_014857 [Vanilla planifolia]